MNLDVSSFCVHAEHAAEVFGASDLRSDRDLGVCGSDEAVLAASRRPDLVHAQLRGIANEVECFGHERLLRFVEKPKRLDRNDFHPRESYEFDAAASSRVTFQSGYAESAPWYRLCATNLPGVLPLPESVRLVGLSDPVASGLFSSRFGCYGLS